MRAAELGRDPELVGGEIADGQVEHVGALGLERPDLGRDAQDLGADQALGHPRAERAAGGLELERLRNGCRLVGASVRRWSESVTRVNSVGGFAGTLGACPSGCPVRRSLSKE